MNRDTEKLGTALRLVRESAGKFAKDVAAQAGFSASYLSELERGVRRVSDGAMAKLAPAFGLDLPAFRELLEKRAAEMRRDEVNPGTAAGRQISDGSSSRLHDAPFPSRAMTPSTPDTDALLRHLVEKLSREEKFALLRELMKEAEAGDATAFAKARALFDLIPPEVVPVHPSSG